MKNWQLGPHQSEKLLHSKVKRRRTEWEKVCARHGSGWGLTPHTGRTWTAPQKNHRIKSGRGEGTGTSPKKMSQWPRREMFLVTQCREMQTKTTVTHPLPPVQRAKTNNTEKNRCRRARRRGALVRRWWERGRPAGLEDRAAAPPKLNTDLLYDPQVHFWVFTQRK